MKIEDLFIFCLCIATALCDRKVNSNCSLNIDHFDLNSTTYNRCLVEIICNTELSKDFQLDFDSTVKVNSDIDEILNDINILPVHIMCEPPFERKVYIIINASGLNLTSIDLFLTWQQIHEVNVSHNNISIVKDHDFKYVEDVSVMDLSHNKIETISQYAFVNSEGICISMKKLLLQNNNLRNLEEVMLSSEKSLQYLDVSNNNLETLSWIEKSSYNNLVTIILDNNKLTFIGKHFHYMTKLEKISFAGNSIKNINPVAFSQLISLNYLDISSNNLEALQPSMFDGLHSLLYLNLSHNKIDGITEEYFSDSGSLKTLDLSHNSLDQFELTHKRMFAPINYLLLNDNNLSETDIADVLKFPLKVRRIRIGSNNFNCKHLIYIHARQMVHRKYKSHPKEKDEDIEIDCSTADRIEVFGFSPRDPANDWNTFPTLVHEYRWEKTPEFLREVLLDDSSVLVELKLHFYNDSKNVIDSVSSNVTKPKVEKISVKTIVWTSVIIVTAVLLTSFGCLTWRRYPALFQGWRILNS